MTPERWSVWLANLDPVVGSEQGRTRPVLVLSETSLNHILPVVNLLPITSRKPNRRVYPNEALIPAGTAGLDLDSIVLCYQIRNLEQATAYEESRNTKRDKATFGSGYCVAFPACDH